MSDRRSIEIDGLSHLTQIPTATRIGPLLVSSVITPYDPGTRNAPDSTEGQLANIFTHVAAILEKAGAAWDDVAKMEFWAPRAEMRAAIDPVWVTYFPDPNSRPSRHTHGGGGELITASFLAWVGD